VLPFAFYIMRNSPKNWVAAATVVAASLLDSGCKHPKVPTPPYRPVTKIPDVPERSVTADALRNTLEANDAPIPPPIPTAASPDPVVAQELASPVPETEEGVATTETPLSPAVSSDAMLAQIFHEQETQLPDQVSREKACVKLFEEYTLIVEQLRRQEAARGELLLANDAVKQTRERIAELGKLGPLEYSDDEVALFRDILIKNKSNFTSSAMIASNAISIGSRPCEVDESYPQLSLSADRRVVEVTILLRTTEGGPKSIPISHDVTVGFKITKLGVVPSSTTINNDFPARGDEEFSPEWFEGEVSHIFGAIQFPTGEPNPDTKSE